MTPGIYLQRRRDKLDWPREKVGNYLVMALVARGVNDGLPLEYRVQTALMLIEHDIMIAPTMMAEALGQCSALQFDPETYFALVRWNADPAALPRPPVCRSCGAPTAGVHEHLCGLCRAWGEQKMRLAEHSDARTLMAANIKLIEEAADERPAD